MYDVPSKEIPLSKEDDPEFDFALISPTEYMKVKEITLFYAEWRPAFSFWSNWILTVVLSCFCFGRKSFLLYTY